MIAKHKEKQKAIELRKQGFSYGEILKKVLVSKASLSLWLSNIKLTSKQRKRLTDKWIISREKGWEARRRQKIETVNRIKKEAKREVGHITKRDLWMVGTALYWAEGCKEIKTRSSLVILGNSDPYLIKIFLKWLRVVCKVPSLDIHFRVYLHETSSHRLKEVQKYWANVTGFPLREFERITWKKHKPKTLRKNVGKDYFGLLDVIVRRSTNFNRKIAGWIDGIHNKI